MRDDRTYFSRRAETELEMAQRATCPAAVKAHYTMAEVYLDRVHASAEPPDGGRVGEQPPGATRVDYTRNR